MIDRRTFLTATGATLLAWPAGLRGVARAAHHEKAGLPAETLTALAASPYVYVSPLRSDGEESRCHGEVWYGWLDGAVVLNTAPKTWKARALELGLERARIWVGDHGRWKKALGRNEAFRAAPHFDARAERSRDAELSDRLLALYDTKYPEEIGDWRDKMRRGVLDGSRLLIRYLPLT